MYDKLLKSILYLWGFVFLVFGIKFVISNTDTLGKLSKNAWEKASVYILDLTHEDKIKLTLIKKYGMTIEGISLCKDEYKSVGEQTLLNSSLSNISSSCWNGDCKVSLAFKDKVPKTIKLTVQHIHSDNCLIETYNVGSEAQVVGYQVKVIMTNELEEKLGLQSENQEIKFKHQTGYTKTRNNEKYIMTFDFDKLLTSDVLIVDDEEKLTIYFELK